MNGQICILANGEFPKRPELRTLLREAACVICCDGAADKLLSFGREPDWIVGDLDSLSPDVKGRFRKRLVHFSEQETNDLAKVFRFCRARKIVPTALLGAGGGREDHLLGNLARFAEAAGEFPQLRFYTECGEFAAFSRRAEFTGIVPGTQLSVISLDSAAEITAAGVKYPLDHLKLPAWYAGTLNEATAPTLTFQCSGAAPVLIYFCHENCK